MSELWTKIKLEDVQVDWRDADLLSSRHYGDGGHFQQDDTTIRLVPSQFGLKFIPIVGAIFWPVATIAASELVEMQTGAWWRPVWLMIWKGACITTLVSLGIGHYRWRRALNDHQDAGPKKSEDVMLPPN